MGEKEEDILLLGGRTTMWKFEDFFVIQILREINFGESRSSRTAVCVVFGALNIGNLVNFNFLKVQKFLEIKIQRL